MVMVNVLLTSPWLRTVVPLISAVPLGSGV